LAVLVLFFTDAGYGYASLKQTSHCNQEGAVRALYPRLALVFAFASLSRMLPTCIYLFDAIFQSP
jgi:hypothetical protein